MLAIGLSSCGSSTESMAVSSAQTAAIENTASQKTEYNVPIYTDDYVSVTCTAICNDRVEFDVSSKLKNNNISVSINSVALDGVVPPVQYLDGSFVDVEPGSTVKAAYGGDINFTDHRTMSASMTVFNDEGSWIENIDAADIDLGGKANKECEEPDGTLVYDAQELGITYVGPDEKGIRLRVHNKIKNVLYISLDGDFFINQVAYQGESGLAYTLPAKSYSDYYVRVKDIDPDYVPESVKRFQETGTYYDQKTLSVNFNIDSDVEVTTVGEKETGGG